MNKNIFKYIIVAVVCVGLAYFLGNTYLLKSRDAEAQCVLLGLGLCPTGPGSCNCTIPPLSTSCSPKGVPVEAGDPYFVTLCECV